MEFQIGHGPPLSPGNPPDSGPAQPRARRTPAAPGARSASSTLPSTSSSPRPAATTSSTSSPSSKSPRPRRRAPAPAARAPRRGPPPRRRRRRRPRQRGVPAVMLLAGVSGCSRFPLSGTQSPPHAVARGPHGSAAPSTRLGPVPARQAGPGPGPEPEPAVGGRRPAGRRPGAAASSTATAPGRGGAPHPYNWYPRRAAPGPALREHRVGPARAQLR